MNRMDPDCAITAGRAHCLKEKPDKKPKRKDTLFMSWEEKKMCKDCKWANTRKNNKELSCTA